MRASCACGAVRFEAAGAPLASAVCYCADCQAGGRIIEALPGAPRVLDADGGASYLVYRDDRFRCVSGEDKLVAYRLKEQSPTRRMVASCCNSGMFVKFERGFWTSAYRLRFSGDLPPVEMRNQTQGPQSRDAPALGRAELCALSRALFRQAALGAGQNAGRPMRLRRWAFIAARYRD